MNDLDLCLEVYQGHVNHCITFDVSRKPLQTEACSKGPPIWNCIWAIKWSRDRWRHVTQRC